MRPLIVALLLAGALAVFAADRFDLDPVEPSTVGMNAHKLAEIPVRMREFVAAGTISGVVTILARHG